MKRTIVEDPELKSSRESEAHYRVPEGYFDDLPSRVMARIDVLETVAEEAPDRRVTLFVRVKPLLYLAASFLLMIGLFRAVDYTYRSRGQQAQIATVSPKASEIKMVHQQKEVDQEYFRYLQSEYEDLLQTELAASGIWVD